MGFNCGYCLNMNFYVILITLIHLHRRLPHYEVYMINR